MKEKWDDYGESSLTLLAVHCGMDKQSPAIPHDPSDFFRCVHLFECLNFTEYDGYCLVNKAAGKYRMWKPFAKNWIKLMVIYDDKKDERTGPKLYAAIQECNKEVKNEKSKS